ncbi:MAG: ABC transporter permease subunit [Bacteriovoracaceae bacterium]|nr:ABC transporter permease subunit [Bacteriovoracaceae bacterium]
MNSLIPIIFVILTLGLKNIYAAPIVIGSKKFTESVLLGEILSILLEKKFNAKVSRKFGLGGTKIAFDALVNGDIDTYPEYTGTGYVMILKLDGERNPLSVFNIVNTRFKKNWNIEWSQPLGFNNTYALAVRKNDNRFKFKHQISDLSGRMERIKYAAPYEFMERKDGHNRFSRHYNFNLKPDNIISMEAGLMYSAINDQAVDMIIVYSTDGRIKSSSLRLLKDNKSFFPPYYASFLFNQSAKKTKPMLTKAIKQLEGMISEKDMVEMNDLVDRLKQEPYSVANNFLIKKEIIKEKPLATKENMSFLSFAYSKRTYLLKLLWEHLTISIVALFLGCLISLPSGILLTRYQQYGKIVFPVINIIQTIPSVALLGFLIPLLGIGFYPAMVTLFLYSLLPLIRNTYSGILSVEKFYIEAARGIGLTNLQILLKIEIPLALPIVLAGVRTAAIIIIGTATLAALIGAGGFGDPIFRGVATVNTNLILIGAIPAALLAIIVDQMIGLMESSLLSDGIKLNKIH